MNRTDVEAQADDLSAIYAEIFNLGTQTLHLSREHADRWACWYCSTGGHIEEQDFSTN